MYLHCVHPSSLYMNIYSGRVSSDLFFIPKLLSKQDDRDLYSL